MGWGVWHPKHVKAEWVQPYACNKLIRFGFLKESSHQVGFGFGQTRPLPTQTHPLPSLGAVNPLINFNWHFSARTHSVTYGIRLEFLESWMRILTLQKKSYRVIWSAEYLLQHYCYVEEFQGWRLCSPSFQGCRLSLLPFFRQNVLILDHY